MDFWYAMRVTRPSTTTSVHAEQVENTRTKAFGQCTLYTLSESCSNLPPGNLLLIKDLNDTMKDPFRQRTELKTKKTRQCHQLLVFWRGRSDGVRHG